MNVTTKAWWVHLLVLIKTVYTGFCILVCYGTDAYEAWMDEDKDEDAKST